MSRESRPVTIESGVYSMMTPNYSHTDRYSTWCPSSGGAKALVRMAPWRAMVRHGASAHAVVKFGRMSPFSVFLRYLDQSADEFLSFKMHSAYSQCTLKADRYVYLKSKLNYLKRKLTSQKQVLRSKHTSLLLELQVNLPLCF